MTKLKFKNYYETIGNKGEEFVFKQEDKESLTDQTQLASASLVEMAKKYGIDAMIARAEQTMIESEKLKDILYGNDFTQAFKSKEEMLNVKKRVANVFENIPARMRKELFNDDVKEFVNAYTGTDEKKLTGLRDVGLISDTQLNAVKAYNKEMSDLARENTLRQQFIEKLESMKGGLYENFKKNGTISESDININTQNSQNVQGNI